MLKILTRPDVSSLLSAFQPMPQTGSILVPGAFVGETAYQAPVTDENAMRLARSMFLLSEEVDSFPNQDYNAPIADGRWRIEDADSRKNGNTSEWFLLGSSEGNWLSVDIEFQYYSVLKKVEIETGRRYEDEDRVSQTIKLDCLPQSFGATAKIFTEHYEITCESDQALNGLRLFLKQAPAARHEMGLYLSHYILRSGQYDSLEESVGSFSIEEGNESIKATLYRPPRRANRLMPIVAQLQLLWDAVFRPGS